MGKMVGECECCQLSDVELNEFSTTGYAGCKLGEPKIFRFCDLCYKTFAGNSHLYPRQYEGRAEIMQHICAVANIMLKKLQK